MKKSLLILCSFILISFGVSCNKEQKNEVLEIESVSEVSFTHKGGLGSIVVSLDEITVTSSAEEWLKVQNLDSRILFNVYSNPLAEGRSGTIIIKDTNSEQLVEVEIMQSGFVGLIVTPTTLNFSDLNPELSVAVVASGEFSVELTENPNNVFSYVVDGKLVKFSVNVPQGRQDISGRAVITPSDGGEAVTVTLVLPEKSVYDYLIGTWQMTGNTNSTPSYPMTFKVKESQASYYVYVDAPGIKAYPFTAEFINGNVKVSTGQEMGNDGTTYYNFHFNGPINGQGTYIFNQPGRVAMEATPIFNEGAKTITLRFVDNGQGKESQARDWAFFCGSRYWSFESNVAFFTNVELQKSYIE